MNNLIFKPQDIPKRYTIRTRLKGYDGSFENNNFVSRTKWYPAGWRFNKQTLGKAHSRLHYLACHAPKPIQKKYKKIYSSFYKKHFGTHHASVRYLNNYSCHSWM
jgi:hypothetical protein